VREWPRGELIVTFETEESPPFPGRREKIWQRQGNRPVDQFRIFSKSEKKLVSVLDIQ